LSGNLKSISDVRIGDTVTHEKNPCKEALPGYKEPQSMVFCGLYPINSTDFTALRDALGKLNLNDSSFKFEPETSQSLGFGFRCGFLGLLHMEIIQQRLEREFGLNLLITAPSVVYRIQKTNKTVIYLDNPAKMPKPNEIDSYEEPYINATIIIPAEYLGPMMQLSQDRRGIYKSTEYLDTKRVILHYDMPLSEVLVDFYDHVKSLTRGYGSFNYEFIGYKEAELVKLDILINDEVVDALSTIVFKDSAYQRGKALVAKLQEVIPRQMFEVAIQAAIGSRVISRFKST
jgi:GTP-binding protein LepA